MLHDLIRYFDKVEDRIRGRLARYPIIYTLIGGAALVLFWRGVWTTVDQLAYYIPEGYAWIDGPLSILVSVVVLLITGLFVSFFITDRIILSGVRQEKKLVEKTEIEVRKETDIITELVKKIEDLEEIIRHKK